MLPDGVENGPIGVELVAVVTSVEGFDDAVAGEMVVEVVVAALLVVGRAGVLLAAAGVDAATATDSAFV